MKLFARRPAGLPSNPDDPILQDWYHTIDLGKGMVTQGYYDHRTIADKYGLPDSLAGMSALDVGSGDGFFAFEMERRGASRVVAVDVDSLKDCDWVDRMRGRVAPETMESQNWKNRFEIAHKMLKSKVERIQCDVYQLGPDRVGTFDVVFCGDLLLHLQNPLRALQNIRRVCEGVAVIETPIDEDLEARFPDRPMVRFGAREAEKEPGELNTFWRVNTQALEDMLVYADFSNFRRQGLFKLPPFGVAVTSIVAEPAR